MKYGPLTSSSFQLARKLARYRFVQLHIICDGERHHEASYSKTWRRREIIDIIYALFHLKTAYNHACLAPVCLPRLYGSLDLVKVSAGKDAIIG
jgi:hypothetical protein